MTHTYTTHDRHVEMVERKGVNTAVATIVMCVFVCVCACVHLSVRVFVHMLNDSYTTHHACRNGWFNVEMPTNLFPKIAACFSDLVKVSTFSDLPNSYSLKP